MNSFENKIAFITGAATGIGRATALNLAMQGAKVMVTDINEILGQETVNLIKKVGGNARFFKLDVGDKNQIDEVISTVMAQEGQLDLAVNNAGIGGAARPLHEITVEHWNKMMNINLSGVFWCLQAEIKCMLAKGGGRIVNVASLAGVNGVPGGSSYCAAKHGVAGLTKTAAMEYGGLNIRINAICPGFIQTSILNDVPDTILKYSTEYRVPMKRIGQPEEVANTIAWLLSEEATYVHGHLMFLDGGFKAG